MNWKIYRFWDSFGKHFDIVEKDAIKAREEAKKITKDISRYKLIKECQSVPKLFGYREN